MKCIVKYVGTALDGSRTEPISLVSDYLGIFKFGNDSGEHEVLFELHGFNLTYKATSDSVIKATIEFLERNSQLCRVDVLMSGEYLSKTT